MNWKFFNFYLKNKFDDLMKRVRKQENGEGDL